MPEASLPTSPLPLPDAPYDEMPLHEAAGTTSEKGNYAEGGPLEGQACGHSKLLAFW
jgi:hypothetical protein